MIEEKTGHVLEALDRLVTQFKNLPKIQAMISLMVQQIQELETAAFQVLLERGLETAVGVQLDGLGSIVGEGREGRTDEDYRIGIRARILLNNSEGTPEDMLAIMRLVTGETGLRIWEYYPAAFILELTADRPDPLPANFWDIIERWRVFTKASKPAGVQAHLAFHPLHPFQYDGVGPGIYYGYDQGHWGTAIEDTFTP